MKRMPSKLFWISLFIPVLILTGMLVKPITTITSGDEVVLATIPIDPRDLFYGDYVILDLEIENVDANLLKNSLREQIENDEYSYRERIPVYVSLKEESGIYQASAISTEKPKGLFIKGDMYAYIDNNDWNEEEEYREFVSIDYGIERFYVEEGTGLELERQAREGKVLVTAKIKDGYAILTDIKGIQ